MTASKQCTEDKEPPQYLKEEDQEETCDEQEALDYESLLDIEVRSLQCDCNLDYESRDLNSGQYHQQNQHGGDTSERPENAQVSV